MYFGVKVDDILGPSKRTRVVQARHVAVAVVRALVRWSYPEIARAFGRVDFTSAYNSCARVNEDPELAAMAMRVGAELHERMHTEAA